MRKTAHLVKLEKAAQKVLGAALYTGMRTLYPHERLTFKDLSGPYPTITEPPAPEKLDLTAPFEVWGRDRAGRAMCVVWRPEGQGAYIQVWAPHGCVGAYTVKPEGYIYPELDPNPPRRPLFSHELPSEVAQLMREVFGPMALRR